MGLGQRVIPQQALETRPVQTRTLALSVQPLVPRYFAGSGDVPQRWQVAVDPEVVEVASDAACERGVLLLDLLMPVAPARALPGKRSGQPIDEIPGSEREHSQLERGTRLTPKMVKMQLGLDALRRN